MSKLYIGICGVSRSGKNLFADISRKILKEEFSLTSNSYALAYYLKKDCEFFVKEKLGMNVFSENTQEKSVFRPLLVWFGDVKRKQTEGRYWTEKLQLDIEKDSADVVFVTDIRYDWYAKDETYWIKEELKGKLIHISKYTHGFPADGRRIRDDISKNLDKIYIEPANDHELYNDPKVKAKADIQFEWEHIAYDNQPYEMLVNHSYLNGLVRDVYKQILK